MKELKKDKSFLDGAVQYIELSLSFQYKQLIDYLHNRRLNGCNGYDIEFKGYGTHPPFTINKGEFLSVVRSYNRNNKIPSVLALDILEKSRKRDRDYLYFNDYLCNFNDDFKCYLVELYEDVYNSYNKSRTSQKARKLKKDYFLLKSIFLNYIKD